nr:MAG TPA: hypothetical protein [Caudoviricetes sp.]
MVGSFVLGKTREVQRFYTIYRRDGLRTRERKIEQWHLHANF